MPTIADLKAFTAKAKEKFGDPCAPVCQLVFKWYNGNGMEYRGEDLIASIWGSTITLWLGHEFPLAIPVTLGPALYKDVESMTMVAWSIIKLGPGVWTFDPSFRIANQFHGFVILVDVPEPAPWVGS